MMRILHAILMLGIAAGMAEPQDKPARGPRLQFDETAFDFGRINEGKVAEHIFRFTNAGTDTLKITKVDASCGCTATVLTQTTIAPGGQGEIKATFDSRGRIGKARKSIYVRSNDTQSPIITLMFTAEVLAASKEEHGSFLDVLKN